jgi:hypothetical protein
MPKGTRSLLLIVMDLLWVVAVLDVIRLVVAFFGRLASSGIGAGFLDLSVYLVVPFGLSDPATPYGGVFELDTAATVVLLLLVEWIVSIVRRRS